MTLNGLDAVRDFLGGDLSPDAIALSCENGSEVLRQVARLIFPERLKLMKSVGCNPIENYVTADVSIVTISRARLPAWDDSFVDELIKPVFFGHRVVVEDPIKYAAFIKPRRYHLDELLNKDSPVLKKRLADFRSTQKEYLQAALHVSQLLAPLIDCGAVVLADPIHGIGWNPRCIDDFDPLALYEALGSKKDGIDTFLGRLSTRREIDYIYYDIAFWAGCDFIGTPWVPDGKTFDDLISRLKTGLGIDLGTYEPSTIRLSRLVSPPQESLSPSRLAELWESTVFEDWVGHLKSLALTAVQLAEQGEGEVGIKMALRSRIKDLRRHSEAMVERSLKSQITGIIRDSAFGTAGILLAAPLGTVDIAAAMAATGATGMLSVLTRLLVRSSHTEVKFAKLLQENWSALLAG